MSVSRKRFLYFAGAIIVIFLGLASRRYRAMLPELLADYAGDTLWALMVFLGVSAIFPLAALRHRAIGALVFAFTIEVSQLYHAPWIDALRQTRLGGLVLGFGFLATDLVCYTVGVLAGGTLELLVRRVSVGQHSAGRNESA